MPKLEHPSQRDWLSLAEVARVVGVSYPTALKDLRNGKVRATKVGGIWRVYKEDVEPYQAFRDPF